MNGLFLLIGFCVFVPIIILYFMFRSASTAIKQLNKDWKAIINKPFYVPGFGLWITYMIIYLSTVSNPGNFIEFLGVTLMPVLIMGLLWIPIYEIFKKILIRKLEYSYCNEFFDYKKLKEDFLMFKREIKRIFQSEDIGICIDSYHSVLVFSYYWRCSKFCDSEFSIMTKKRFNEINELHKPAIPWQIENNYEDYGSDVAYFTYYDIVYYIEIPNKETVSYKTIKKILSDNCGIRTKKLER